jgi:hypothetical protein
VASPQLTYASRRHSAFFIPFTQFNSLILFVYVPREISVSCNLVVVR